ncbi:glycosyltransferase [Deinococcus aquiradiocola]|uniref:Glycosyltransferase 2-like domain-containing protein n=1 Tax=Deinococcus aquiradiocola TaxID=393059 RepID=A0A917UQJ4_9DEIO|nr:glycosyltransferase [Deinococcus aquiradiocola]GGJ76369.1 hypothetical protein GCM10008939_20730 [Deinococcus aquiradiocola]
MTPPRAASRAAGRGALCTALAFVAFKGAVLLVNALTFPRLQPHARPRPTRPGRVSLLVPARDETVNLRRTLPALLSQGAHEVIVLDDHSTDGTADLARTLGARVLQGAPLPDGWYGKPWACQQLGEAATGDTLIFTDADVTWSEGALPAVLDALDVSGAALLSVLPRPAHLMPGARLLTPLVDAVVLSWLPFPLLRARPAWLTSANGQLMAFRRDAYTRAGGYRAVKAEMLEDTVFARRLKRAGERTSLALGGQAVQVTMYAGYRDSVRGFSKNALPIHAHSRALLLASLAAHLLVYTVPWLLPARHSRAMWALRLVSLGERGAVNLVTGRRRVPDLLESLLGPVTPLLALPGYLLALRRTVRWKGRTYRQ